MYEYLLDFVDDETALNLLSVNKKFRNEKLFEKIMKKRYPLLKKYKKDSESWKFFFIEMTTKIENMKKEYDIPYIPSENFNPRCYDDYMHILVSAAQIGFIEVIEKMINIFCSFSKETFDEIFTHAYDNNQMKTCDFLIHQEDEDGNLWF